MAPTLSEVLSVVECTRDDFNNWKRRDILSTRLPNSRAGVAQEVSRKTALELAFLSALTSGGFDIATAVIETANWLREETAGKLAPRWAGNPRHPGGNTIGFSFEVLNDRALSNLAVALSDDEPVGYSGEAKVGKSVPATMLVIIDRGEIVRKIDQLYTEKSVR